jgi:hypothetical protein
MKVLFYFKKLEDMDMKNRELLHLTTNHTGKMKGMMSLSTCCKSNPWCQQHCKVEGSVCQKCYAQRMMKMYTNMDVCLERNAEILTSKVIPIEDLPLVNACYFRFEAFGDLINETQLINYFNICRKNPDTHFALWTKNPHIVKNVVSTRKKPKNLQIILSSLFINEEIDISNMPHIDKVFTVYDQKTIDEDGIEINCGAKSCLKCHQCYKSNGNKYIREKLK